MGKAPASYPIPTVCDFCGSPVVFGSNANVYGGRTYGNGKCYMCTKCDTYVGVHDGTKIPKGRLANKEMRALKIQCHELFDTAWRGRNSRMNRGQAYQRLALLLGIPHQKCHFGWFGIEELNKCLEIMSGPKWQNRANG